MKKLVLTGLIAAVLVVSGVIVFKNYSKISKVSVKESYANITEFKDLKLQALNHESNSVTLVWHKIDGYKDIVSYNVYMNGKLIGNSNNNNMSVAKEFMDKFYNDSSNASAVKISMHNYIVNNLSANTAYKFQIAAVYKNGKEDKKSNEITVHTDTNAEVFDVTKYGAIGDGNTIDTKAVQAAIDACTNGGEVLIPKGKVFKVGALWLKPNMTLRVDGELLGSENPEDFVSKEYSKKNKSIKNPALINAVGSKNSKNLKIIGTGIINGNGWKQGLPDSTTGFPVSLKSNINTVKQNGILAANQFEKGKESGLSDVKAYGTRSDLVSITNIADVYLGDGLSMENPSQQTIGISGCNNLVINNLEVKTFDCNNGDGIDFDSKGLTVVNSIFDTGDDDINFTAGKGAEAEKKRKPASDAWIFDNYFGKGHGAVVAGSNTGAWIENILAEDNVLNGTGAGLRCKTAPANGGGAKNIVFRDTAMKNITDDEGQPFIFTADYNNKSDTSNVKPAKELPVFKHIFVSNCSIDGAKSYAIFVDGLEKAYDEDIHFQDVAFKNTIGAKLKYLKDSSFENVSFDKSTRQPWNKSRCKNITFDEK